jgi:hypothetical protein
MRTTSSATTISWIPSEAVTGINKALFETGFTHYDDPPPDTIEDVSQLQVAERFRFVNVLAVWAEFDGYTCTASGYEERSGSMMGSTTLRLGSRDLATFAAPALADIRHVPDVRDDHTPRARVRFVQTVGGHTAFPAPRRVTRPPFVQWRAPLVWTTLAITLHCDGASEFELVGASPFPRHWVYDAEGRLAAKAGLANFKEWWRKSFGKHTPWGDEESPAFVTEVETALERKLSTTIMRSGEKPDIRTVKKGATIVAQGEPGNELFLVLDGVVTVEVDGEALGEIGPGAVVGERAIVENGSRTATLKAQTRVRLAAVRGDQVEEAALRELAQSAGHRREELR